MIKSSATRALYPVHSLTPVTDGQAWRRHYRRPPRFKRTIRR